MCKEIIFTYKYMYIYVVPNAIVLFIEGKCKQYLCILFSQKYNKKLMYVCMYSRGMYVLYLYEI